MIIKAIRELEPLCDVLETESNQFFGKLKKEEEKYTSPIILVKKTNNKEYVFIRDIKNCETTLYIDGSPVPIDIWDDDDGEECRFNRRCKLIKEKIIEYNKGLDDLMENYKEIRKRIGIKLFNKDLKLFKEQILNTTKDLNVLINDYEWEF